MLQLAKDRIDAGKAPKTMMICCWNKLAEGHFIEPSSGNGFTYLDAVRNVFVGNTPHVDRLPRMYSFPGVGAPHHKLLDIYGS